MKCVQALWTCDDCISYRESFCSLLWMYVLCVFNEILPMNCNFLISPVTWNIDNIWPYLVNIMLSWVCYFWYRYLLNYLVRKQNRIRFSNMSNCVSLLGVCLGEGPWSGNQIKVGKVTMRRDPLPRVGRLPNSQSANSRIDLINER